MRFKDYEIPEGLLYTKEHEWVETSEGVLRVGITEYASKTLGDVVYVTLPPEGRNVMQFESLGTLESIKAISELYSPLSGAIAGLNPELGTRPELVNQSPYHEGWLLLLKPSDPSETKNLLAPIQYAELLRSLDDKQS